MDILHLVDRMEELFNEGRPVPFTHSVVVNEDRMLDLIDQMRVAIPDEVKKAKQLLVQRDRILAQAQEEANRTLSIAREKSDQLMERDSIIQAARASVKDIHAQAFADAEITRNEADEYVIETLRKLEAELVTSLNQARNGIMTLQASLNKQEAAEEEGTEEESKEPAEEKVEVPEEQVVVKEEASD